MATLAPDSAITATLASGGAVGIDPLANVVSSASAASFPVTATLAPASTVRIDAAANVVSSASAASFPVTATLAPASTVRIDAAANVVSSASAASFPVTATLAPASTVRIDAAANVVSSASAASFPVTAGIDPLANVVSSASAASFPVTATLAPASTVRIDAAANVVSSASAASFPVTAGIDPLANVVSSASAASFPVTATLAPASTVRIDAAANVVSSASAASFPVTAGIDPLANVVSSTSAASFPVTATLAPASTITVSAASTSGVLVDTRTLGYATDAFDRLRTSHPVTLYDYTGVLGKMPLRFEEVLTAGGTSTYSTGSYISMAVTAGGDAVVRQSKRYIPYQPGKSQLVLMTGVLAVTGAANVTARIGHFDAVNGHCFQMASGAMSVVAFNAGVATTVPRASWNGDPLDGTGPSGYNVDFTKGVILAFDIQWLGFGRVRCGVSIDGRVIVAHEFSHAPSGGTAITAPYMRYAALPVRYDITSSGGADTMRMTCGTVISESGDMLFAQPFSIASTAALTVSSATFAPLFTITLRADGGAQPWNRVNIRLTSANFINTTNTSFIAWALVKNVVFAGTAPTYVIVDASNSAVQYCAHIAATTASAGYTFASGFSESRASSVNLVDASVANVVALNSSIAGVGETLTLMIAKVSGSNADMFGGMTWEEVI